MPFIWRNGSICTLLPVQEFVAWLRAEMDALGPHLLHEQQERVAEKFARMGALETLFFETAGTDARLLEARGS